MADFPTIIPSDIRAFRPGDYPLTTREQLSGRQVRIRHSNVFLDAQIEFTFKAITTSEMILIRGHYYAQEGSFIPFEIPDDLFQGGGVASDYIGSLYKWSYVDSPVVIDIPLDEASPQNRHDVRVLVRSEPPQSVTVVSGPIVQVVRPPTARANYAIYPPEAVGPPVSSAISPSAVSSYDLYAPTIQLVASDPLFADVELLVAMTGTNGSTTFTDLSNNGYTITANGSAQISTAQGLTGSSGLFQANADYLSVTVPGGLGGTGDFCVEMYVYAISGGGGSWLNTRTNGTSGDGIDILSMNGVSTSGSIIISNNSSITTGQWVHVCVERIGTTVTRYIDGTSNGSGTSSGNFNGTNFRIGGNNYAGGNQGNINGYGGWFRLTVRAGARYGSNFTPPTAPLPSS